jgi:hypothetical protein
MTALASVQPDDGRPRRLLLGALIVTFVLASACVLRLLAYQKAGIDFSSFWAGAKTALSQPGRLYDFDYISGLQGWPLGPGKLRPFVSPPSALLLLAPFALAPFWLSYVLWILLSAGVFLWATLKARLPWWSILLPPVAWVVYCGQTTLLIGGLVLGGLALRRRPILAGVLFGMAAAVKPQLLLLLPIALIADRGWKTILATGATGAGLVAASAAVWGVDAWRQWLAAVGRFQQIIFNDPSMVADGMTPYAALEAAGLPGGWALLLAPLAAGLVWTTFRRTEDPADRLIAVFGGALLVTPYAMNYETALFAPAVAAYLARTAHPRWLLIAAVGAVFGMGLPLELLSLLAVIALPSLARPAPPVVYAAA